MQRMASRNARWSMCILTMAMALVLVPLVVPGKALAQTPEDTVGVFDPATGRWYLRQGESTDVFAETYRFFFGKPGETPIPGDWDCDRWDTPGMYRPADGYVYMRNHIALGDGDIRFYLGDRGDVPIVGDFDGDGCDTVSLYRRSEGRVYIFNRLGGADRGLGAAK